MNKFDYDLLVSVTNRDNGRVGYVIPEMGNLMRQYQPNETKQVPYEELLKLSYLPGGNHMLLHNLMVGNKEVLESLINGEVEPEYYYGKEELREILLNGTLDQLADTIEFSPAGRVELLKETAIEIKLNDISKRDLIQKMTGVNIGNVIANREYANEFVEEKPKKERRVKVAEEAAATGRRTAAPVVPEPVVVAPTPTVAAPEYKIVSENN